LNWHGRTRNDINHIIFTSNNGWLWRSYDRGKTWIAQSGQLGRFLGFFSLDDRHWWFSSWNNFIFRTTNAGKKWDKYQIPDSEYNYIESVNFIDSRQGWCCSIVGIEGRDGGKIFKTNNGGKDWKEQYFTKDCGFWDICFITADSGWATGTNGMIANTINGGQNWRCQTIADEGGFHKIKFADSRHGWALLFSYEKGGSLCYRTEDGGLNWRSMDLGNKTIRDLPDFVNASEGWIAKGNLSKTQDGGRSWQQVLPDNGFSRAISRDSSSCVAIANNTIQTISDNGQVLSSYKLPQLLHHTENIIARKAGEIYPDSLIIIGAHYDCISEDPFNNAPGANDNAVGVAALIELAKLLKDHRSKYTLEFISFAAEEHGLRGSTAYASNIQQSGRKIKAMINLDAIAYSDSSDWIVEIQGDSLSTPLTAIAMDNVKKYTKLLPVRVFRGMGSDHHAFQKIKVPAIALYPKNWFGKHGHSMTDQMETLNIAFASEIIRTVFATIIGLEKNSL